MTIKSQEGFFMESFIKCTWVGRKCLPITALDPLVGSALMTQAEVDDLSLEHTHEHMRLDLGCSRY